MSTLHRHFVVFRDQPLIYGRVPKVANSSVKAALSKLLVGKLSAAAERTQSDGFWKRETNGETRMVTPGGAWRMRKEKFCFAFVRNPFDRIVSCYGNKMLDEKALTEPMEKAGYRLNMSFADFVDLTVSIPDAELDPHFMPQSEMLLFNGQLVPRFVGHFEDLEGQWGRLKRRLAKLHKVEAPALPKKNVRRSGDGADVRSYFTSDDLVEKIARKYRTDMDVFYPGLSPDRLIAGGFDLPEIARPKAGERIDASGTDETTSSASKKGSAKAASA
ncbi:MAG: hypothetical protein DI565_12630 [Ancylobacter novellus]|uniref:Sulfotransferase family protein n=1 Tax=Ancylobacter novellus TaxID=921 RepID=A0A2W5KAU6_ANCNO|nr:MAG: hypothetical protein DI565_12630 [Ancylobacter novellus]